MRSFYHLFCSAKAVVILFSSLLLIGGWTNPPKQNYQYFRFESDCPSGLTIDITQYTSNNYVRSWPSGVKLNGRSPTDQSIKLAPATLNAQQFMRKFSLVAYYIEVKKNGKVCYTLWLTQKDLDLLNAEFERKEPNNPDYVAKISIRGACCTS